jgi:hypothetical protein
LVPSASTAVSTTRRSSAGAPECKWVKAPLKPVHRSTSASRLVMRRLGIIPYSRCARISALSGVAALSGVIFSSSPLMRTSSSLSAAASAATSERRRCNRARRSPRYSSAVAGAAMGSGPASRMAANRAGEISWSSTARHWRLPSTQMSPARSRSRSASRVAASQIRRSAPSVPSTASRQTGRRKLVGKLLGHFRLPLS